MNIAILTGASSGLGRMYAGKIHKIFPEIDEIWALARREGALRELKENIKDVAVRPVPMDVTDDNALETLRGMLAAENAKVMLLINNAGCGFHGAFEKSDIKEQTRSLELNIVALTKLTRLALDFMPEGGRILNTSSIASFAPNAYMAAYSGSKAYVTFFSRALNEELRAGGRSSTAVCPAPMKTEFLTVGHVEGNSKAFERLPYCDVEKVALGALKAAKRRKSVYTPRAFYKFYRVLSKIVPDEILIKLVKT